MAEQTGWGTLLRVVDTVLPGAAGALVSLRFIPGTPVQRVASLLLGIACAHWDCPRVQSRRAQALQPCAAGPCVRRRLIGA
ncbi:hypothetical protein [Ralstonia mannitolilytica]|uniref:hypothetical protein n=1 Tax=Ralstonia mannitolilytica TaxID=105219 RepID=UPI000A6A83CD|nr:hypothetical protein [Ralstonia mannitolilytica]